MKRLLSTLLGIVLFSSMMLASAERADGEADTWWSICCIAVACICGVLLYFVNPAFRRDGILKRKTDQ